MTHGKIPLFKVFMSKEARSAVGAVLESGYIGEGPQVAHFEKELAAYFDAPDVVALNSATSAIEMALRLIGVGPGDEVITTAQTCVATNAPIVNAGATPVFVDIDPRSGLIDPDDVRANLCTKTKAIMAVDWAGHPCDYGLLRGFGIPVIEDAAHSIDTRYNGRHVSVNGGDYVCFSFQAIKHLTTGDGGALCGPVDMLEEARKLRWYGLNRRAPGLRFLQDIPRIGVKVQMNDIAAAIGRANLKETPKVVGAHRANAKTMHGKLASMAYVQRPKWDDGSSWWLYTIQVQNPPDFIEKMKAHGLECSPVHARNDRMSSLRRVARLSKHLLGLDEFSKFQVSIPVGWWLDEKDIDRVVDATARCA